MARKLNFIISTFQRSPPLNRLQTKSAKPDRMPQNLRRRGQQRHPQVPDASTKPAQRHHQKAPNNCDNGTR